MKRSRLSYDEWKCILAKEVRGCRVTSELVAGYVGMIEVHEVSEPQIWKSERLQKELLSDIATFKEFTKKCYEIIK